MTDAGGQYSFAGLAAGDYTVSIAVESDAYVFESMRTDVTLGDDESAIQNFEGAHARTASVTGMVFLDEATKNDMYHEGEAPLAHAGIPVALVGPGVNEQRLGATDAEGAFSFDGLQAGPYQLVVLLDATVAAAARGQRRGLRRTGDRLPDRCRGRRGRCAERAGRHHAHDRELHGVAEARGRRWCGASRRHGHALLG